MSNLSVGQVIFDAERVASRVKDLDSLGSALLVEAEGNNRLVESLRKFQDDLESLNRISNNKSNAEIINRIQQQNAQSSEVLKENRELKICLEDYEYAMEIIMQKYREHMSNKVLDSKLNFREVYNDKLWRIIRHQREKINEMAAVMQHAAGMDDESLNQEQETLSRLRLENETLRELLQISKQYGSNSPPVRFNDHLLIDQGVQTELDDNLDELSLSANSVENANNNTVICNDVHTTTSNLSTATNVTAAITINTNMISDDDSGGGGGGSCGNNATAANDNLNNNHDDDTHEIDEIVTTTIKQKETTETPIPSTTTTTTTVSVTNDQVLIKSVI